MRIFGPQLNLTMFHVTMFSSEDMRIGMDLYNIYIYPFCLIPPSCPHLYAHSSNGIHATLLAAEQSCQLDMHRSKQPQSFTSSSHIIPGKRSGRAGPEKL